MVHGLRLRPFGRQAVVRIRSRPLFVTSENLNESLPEGPVAEGVTERVDCWVNVAQVVAEVPQPGCNAAVRIAAGGPVDLTDLVGKPCEEEHKENSAESFRRFLLTGGHFDLGWSLHLRPRWWWVLNQVLHGPFIVTLTVVVAWRYDFIERITLRIVAVRIHWAITRFDSKFLLDPVEYVTAPETDFLLILVLTSRISVAVGCQGRKRWGGKNTFVPTISAKRYINKCIYKYKCIFSFVDCRKKLSSTPFHRHYQKKSCVVRVS